MTQPRVCVISLNPDIGEFEEGSWSKLMYELERALAGAAATQGHDYVVFGGCDAQPPPGFPATIIPTFTERTDLTLHATRWAALWQQSRLFCDSTMWALDRVRSSRGSDDTRFAFFLYHAHPAHIAAAIDLGLALGGASPIVVNLHYLHFTWGPEVPFAGGPQLRAILGATRGLRRAANVHVRVDSERLAAHLEEQVGERFEVLPFFSLMGDDVDAAPPRAKDGPIRMVFPTAMPSGGKGFELVVGLAERLQRPDVEIITRQSELGTTEVCLPTVPAIAGGLRTLQSFMSGASYSQLLRSSDIVLIPYRRWQFFSRTSGVVADAIRLGKPIVGTADSWIGDQVEASGLGTTFIDGDVDSFVDAVKRAIDQISKPNADVRERRERWLKRNTLAGFLHSVIASGPLGVRVTEAGRCLRLLQLALVTYVLVPAQLGLLELATRLSRRGRAIVHGVSGSLTLFKDPHGIKGRFGVYERLPAIQWKSRGVEATELRLDVPDGFLIGAGGSSGEISSTCWIDDGQRIFLQDVSSGRPLHARHTLDCVRFDFPSDTPRPSPADRVQIWMLPIIRLIRRYKGFGNGRLAVDAPPLGSRTEAVAQVSWTVPEKATIEIRIGSSAGAVFVAAGGSGAAKTGPWVLVETNFLLLDTRPDVPRFLRFLDAHVVRGGAPRYPISGPERVWHRLRPRFRALVGLPELKTAALPVPIEPGIARELATKRAWRNADKRPLESAVSDSEWGIVPPPSTGELFLLARYSKAFLDLHGGSRVVAFVPKGHVSLFRLFPEAPIVGVDRTDFDYLALESGVQQGRILKVAYGAYARPKNGLLGRRQNIRSGFARLFLEELLLPLSADVIEPAITAKVRDSAWRQFRESGLLEGRTVILAPLSYSCQSTTPAAWRHLAAGLLQRGFTVATNCGPDESPIEGTVAMHWDLAELYAGIEIGGALISARSGLCEVCSTTQARFHIVMRDTVLVPCPGITLLPSLEDNGLPDRAIYHTQGLEEDPLRFAQRVLDHPDLA